MKKIGLLGFLLAFFAIAGTAQMRENTPGQRPPMEQRQKIKKFRAHHNGKYNRKKWRKAKRDRFFSRMNRRKHMQRNWNFQNNNFRKQRQPKARII